MRRLISLVSAIVALVALGFVLVNATTVDRRPPSVKTVALSAPAGDARIAQTQTAIDIEFSEPVRHETAEARFRIDPVVEGAFTWNGATVIFTPAHKLPLATTFTITFGPGIEDLAGNADSVGLEPWTFATVGPPSVVRTTPRDGSTGVPLDGSIELVFDRLMDTASVEAAISVQPSIPVTASWNGPAVTLSFGRSLTPATTYEVSVGPTAADTGGSRLGSSFRVAFTTVGAGLAITSVVPADGVAGIGVGTPIAMMFDGPVDVASAGSAIHITPFVEGDVRAVALGADGLGLDASGAEGSRNALVFVPSSPLAPHTTYTVTVDPVVARADDPAAVATGRTWSFTTGAPTASVQNQITFLGARGGVRNVWVMNPDGTNQRELTTELLPVSSFDVTADGRRIVYAAGGIVRIMAVDGSDESRLTATDGSLEYGPVLAAGDTQVIVARRDPTGTDAGFWLVPLPGASGEARQIFPSGAPAPGSAASGGDDGATIDASPWGPHAVADDAGRSALIVLASGSVAVVRLDGATDDTGPIDPVIVAVSSTGQPWWDRTRSDFIVSGKPAAGGDAALFRIDAKGSVAAIAGTTGAAGPIAVASDGSVAFITAGAASGTAIHVLAGSGQVGAVPATAGRDDHSPAFGPGARTLLIDRTLSGTNPLPDGIWSIDLLTGETRHLTVDGALPRWIP